MLQNKPENPKKEKTNTAIDLPEDLPESKTSTDSPKSANYSKLNRKRTIDKFDIDLPEPPSHSQEIGIQCNLWRLTYRFKECTGALSDFSFTHSVEISTTNSKKKPVITLHSSTQVDHEMEADMVVRAESQIEETDEQMQFYTGQINDEEEEDDEPKIRTYKKVDIIKWLVKSDHSYS